MTIRRLAIFSGVVIVVIGMSIIAWNLYESDRESKIMSEMDNRLASFTLAKGVAQEVSGFISIRSESDYILGKDKFRKIMTDNIYSEYFPTKEYQGGEKYFQIQEVGTTGEIISDSEFIFKLDLMLVEGELSTPLSLLVYIKDNRIHKIQSLG